MWQQQLSPLPHTYHDSSSHCFYKQLYHQYVQSSHSWPSSAGTASTWVGGRLHLVSTVQQRKHRQAASSAATYEAMTSVAAAARRKAATLQYNGLRVLGSLLCLALLCNSYRTCDVIGELSMVAHHHLLHRILFLDSVVQVVVQSSSCMAFIHAEPDPFMLIDLE